MLHLYCLYLIFEEQKYIVHLVFRSEWLYCYEQNNVDIVG